MDQEEDIKFDQICQDSVNCKNEKCMYNHPRKFQGVCINFLRELKNFDGDEDEKPRKCKSKECKLFHFEEEKLRDLMEKHQINGFYCFSFCQKQCGDENCQFVHKSWMQNICVKNFIQVCKKGKECENKRHMNWSQLEKQLQNKFRIQGCSLQEMLENPLKRYKIQEYCLNFQIGECPYKQNECNKKHQDWDDLVTREFQKQVVQPCTKQGIQKDDFQSLNVGEQSYARLICQEKQFFNFKQSLDESNVIDIIFVMDLTGSMKQWKQQVQQNIESVIQQFTKDINNHVVRVGFIGYRDICDLKEDQLVYRNLTRDVKQIINFISKLEVKGGGDEAEDVVKGLQQILNLNISRNQESMLCIFLIADSPCHGKQYHDMNFKGADYQLEKVQGTPLEDVMKAIQSLKLKNFFFCIKITENTNKMFEIMQQIMKDMLIITPQTKPEQLAETVLFTLQQSYTQSQIIKKKNNKNWFDASFEKPKIDSLGELGDAKESEKFWYQYQWYIKNRCRKGDTCLEIELSDEKSQKDLSNTQQSNKTVIFNAFDAINNQYVVLKINKQYLLEYEQKGCVNERLISQAEEEAEIRYYAQSYACQIAEIYREKTKKIQQKYEFPPIFYAIPILYKLQQPFKGLKQIYGESKIKNRFQKYTTNEKSISNDFHYYTVFSHFSYQLSNELFVATDLQGSYSIFTDPSFQVNQKKLKQCESSYQCLQEQFIFQKDQTNLGQNGIELFFNDHKQCSNLCKILGLKPLHSNISYHDIPYYPSNKEQLQIICDECNSFADIVLNEYYQQVQKTLCQKCKKEENEKNYEVCNCCRYIYTYSENISTITSTKTGICLECKRLNCEQDRKCYYCQKYCSKFPISAKVIQNQQILICSTGQNYLESLKCQICTKSYNYQQLIPKQDYEKDNFICCKI